MNARVVDIQLLATILTDVSLLQRKISSWNNEELQRVKEMRDLMRGGSRSIEDHHQTLIHLRPSIDRGLEALRAAYNDNGTVATEEIFDLKAALQTGIEAMERMSANVETSLQYVEEMERRMELVHHKIETQIICIKDHEESVENRLELLNKGLAVLNGQLIPIEHNVRAMVTKKLDAHAMEIITMIEVGVAFVLGVLSLGLYLVIGLDLTGSGVGPM